MKQAGPLIITIYCRVSYRKTGSEQKATPQSAQIISTAKTIITVDVL